jgi:nucleotide-binding universal stress UspA family protein
VGEEREPRGAVEPEDEATVSAIRNILVPIAFSRYSPGLLAYAAALAQRLGAELLVVNVINVRMIEAVSGVESMGYRVDTEGYRRSLEEERRGLLREMLDKASIPSDRLRVVFKVGHPFEKLLQVIEEERPDLVVMGTKAHSELEHILLGSVAEKMFRHSPVSILSYRE